MGTIDKISMMHVAVRDVDKAKEFYTEKLGFKAVNDSRDFRPGDDRWVSIVPPGGGTSINLTNVFENMTPGSMKLYLSTPDIQAAFKDLQARGVTPTDEITPAAWGTSFGFDDPDGNHWRVVESKY